LKTIIAIDPGASGAMAWLADFESVATTAFDVEQLRTLRALYETDLVAYVEQVGGYIGKPQPGSAMFKFGTSYGRALGALEALRIRTVLVRPQVWQKTIGLGSTLKGPERKRALRDVAKRLWPSNNVTLANCDALLILEHAIQAEAQREGGAT
jgi:hypothetical protein